MTRRTADNPLASGCLALVGLPVVAGGLLLIVQSASGAVTAPAGIAGFAFLLFGSLLIHASARAVRAGKREDALRADYPDQPWRWREEWRDGAIAPGIRHHPTLPWLVALGACAAAGSLMSVEWHEAEGPWRAVLVALGAMVGLVPLGRAWRHAAARAPFRRARLQLRSFPAVLGERLRASVRLPLMPPGDVTVQVRCVRAAPASSLRRPGEAVVLWSAEVQATARPCDGPNPGMEVLIDHPLPAEAPTSDATVSWVIEIRCRRGGRDLAEIWEIPVFASAAGSEG